MIMKATTLAILLGVSLAADAQDETQAAQTSLPPVCQTDPEFKAFHFWVGDWKVVGFKGEQPAGKNKISVVENGCAMVEEWTDIFGGTGQSLNYYNPMTKKWRQVWVSAGAGGNAIDYEGGMVDGSMVLEGTIWFYAQKKSAPFRGTWTPLEDGSVRQFFEQYEPEKETWVPLFEAKYVRQDRAG